MNGHISIQVCPLTLGLLFLYSFKNEKKMVFKKFSFLNDLQIVSFLRRYSLTENTKSNNKPITLTQMIRFFSTKF